MRVAAACAGGALLLAAILLPVPAIVETLSTRTATVRTFPQDFADGLNFLRVALAANGLIAFLLPWLLKRCAFEPPPAPPPNVEWRPAAGLYLVTLLLALPGLAGSFQDDEWRTLEQYIRHGPLVIVTRSAADNQALYSLLAWPFVALIGAAEVPVRIPALLLSPLAAPLLYALLRRRHGKGTAFLSSLPLAASPFLVQYACEGRAYGPLMAAVLGMALLHPALLGGSRRAWVAYIALGILAVYLHIFAATAVMGLWAGALAEPGARSRTALARSTSAALAIAGVSFLLYAPVLPQYAAYSARAGTLEGPGALAVVGDAFAWPLPAAAALPFVAILLAGALLKGRDPALLAAFAAAAAFQAALCLATAAEHAARFYVPALALGWSVAAHGLALTFRRRAAAAALGLLLAGVTAGSVFELHRRGKRDYRAAAREIGHRKRPGETLAVLFDGRPLTPYLSEPPAILDPASLIRARPDWFVVVDANLRLSALEDWVGRSYGLEFRLPSARGAILGYRLKAP